MSVAITIQLSPQAIALANKFKNAPQQFPEAIKRGMTRALEVTSGRIQEKRLKGHGPFPPSEHRLGQRSGELQLKTRSVPVRIENAGSKVEVVGGIGSSARSKGFSYPLLHEFGGKFAPERAPFRTGINENLAYISKEIEKELIASLKK